MNNFAPAKLTKARTRSSAGKAPGKPKIVILPASDSGLLPPSPRVPAEPAPNPDFAAPDFAAMLATLRARGAHDGWAATLAALLEPASISPAELNAEALPIPRRAVFDNRFEHCFEQMLSLIHRQNVQIAELWQLVSDLL